MFQDWLLDTEKLTGGREVPGRIVMGDRDGISTLGFQCSILWTRVLGNQAALSGK